MPSPPRRPPVRRPELPPAGPIPDLARADLPAGPHPEVPAVDYAFLALVSCFFAATWGLALLCARL